jgi:signal transduction histidine kinase
MLSAAGDGSLRASLGWITGVALLLGGAVGGLTFARMRQLEEQSASAESELRSLSGQLRTTQEDERRHLSRELHDQVGQMLTGLRMELAVIGRNQSASAPDVQAAIERAKRNTEQTLSVVRNIAMLLRPSMLDDLGLTPALTWLAKEVEHSGGIEVHREIDPAVDQLPDPHRTCLFRVVQEALTNACRHSGARAVELRVTREAGLVHVRVTDQGVGFDPSAKRNKGLGLLGMEERVRELGGHVYVTSSPGRGVSIEVDLPEPADIGETETHGNHESNDRRRPRDRADRVKAAL